MTLKRRDAFSSCDAFTLLDASNRQHTIRFDGIDAPELGQLFGRASLRPLAHKVGKTPRLHRNASISQGSHRL
jgi:endonuclease YncB( thermonuclease family)